MDRCIWRYCLLYASVIILSVISPRIVSGQTGARPSGQTGAGPNPPAVGPPPPSERPGEGLDHLDEEYDMTCPFKAAAYMDTEYSMHSSEDGTGCQCVLDIPDDARLEIYLPECVQFFCSPDSFCMTDINNYYAGPKQLLLDFKCDMSDDFDVDVEVHVYFDHSISTSPIQPFTINCDQSGVSQIPIFIGVGIGLLVVLVVGIALGLACHRYKKRSQRQNALSNPPPVSNVPSYPQGHVNPTLVSTTLIPNQSGAFGSHHISTQPQSKSAQPATALSAKKTQNVPSAVSHGVNQLQHPPELAEASWASDYTELVPEDYPVSKSSSNPKDERASPANADADKLSVSDSLDYLTLLDDTDDHELSVTDNPNYHTLQEKAKNDYEFSIADNPNYHALQKKNKDDYEFSIADNPNYHTLQDKNKDDYEFSIADNPNYHTLQDKNN